MPGNMSLFDTHMAVDWSAQKDPSPRKPSEDAIWWTVVRDGKMCPVKYVRTRQCAVESLAAFVAEELDAGRRVLAGFDFPFGYPAGVAKCVTGTASALALWQWLDKRIVDKEDNDNNRFKVAQEINRKYSGIGPMWGHPSSQSYPCIPSHKSERTPREDPPEKRIADCRAKGAKTVWQLFGKGSVGSQVLVGLPALQRLAADSRIAGRAAVWPFHTGLRRPEAQFVIAEIYPSLLKPQVDKAIMGTSAILDDVQVRMNAAAFARLDADDRLAPLFEGANDLSCEERCRIETEEGWILGLGHIEALRKAAEDAMTKPTLRR